MLDWTLGVAFCRHIYFFGGGCVCVRARVCVSCWEMADLLALVCDVYL